MAATHGGGKRSKSATQAGKKTGPRKRRAKRGGRPKGLVTRLGLRDFSLERLSELINDARREARRRITQFHSALK